MDQWAKRTQRDYTMAFKLAVLDQMEKGELTYIQAQERYGTQGPSTVLMWLRKQGDRTGRRHHRAEDARQCQNRPNR
jgi:transposase